MEASWYLLHIKPAPPTKEERAAAVQKSEDTKQEATSDTEDAVGAREKTDAEASEMLRVPQVGTPVVHFLGRDPARQAKDSENPLWDKIQDGARPAWAPDFLRLGYAVLFKREGLPKLAAKLGLKNPKNAESGTSSRSGRVLTFDDVWVIGVVPHRSPMYFPDKDLDVENWWLSTKESKGLTSPYLAAGGATVATGAQRLADVVISLLRQPNGFPRIVPTIEEFQDDMSEFVNPLVPVLPVGSDPTGSPDATNYRAGEQQLGYGWAGIELFRYSK